MLHTTIMIFFSSLLLISLVGFIALLSRHLSYVRSLKEEEIREFILTTPSPVKSFWRRTSSLRLWVFEHFSYLFYHFTEWTIKWIRVSLMIVEERLRIIGDYLHGRKIFFHKKRPSPFWSSIHEWKNGLKRGNGSAASVSSKDEKNTPGV